MCFIGLALLLVHSRNASAQVANDSAFQTSPLTAAGISATIILTMDADTYATTTSTLSNVDLA